MPNSADICLRTTRSSIVRPVRASSARRPSSAIPRLTEKKMCPDDDIRQPKIDSSSVSLSSQTIDVYLRLKPRLTKSKRVKKVQDDSYVVLSPSTLVTKFASLEGTTNPSNRSKSPETTCRKFNFTRIFSPESSQSDFFDQAIKQRVVDFLAGQSCTFMSYGTTNAGKSHTFHGNPQAPGIIPRAIEFVFSGVNCTLSPWYKPLNLSEVVSLDESGRCHELELRDSFLTSRSVDKSTCDEAYGSLENSMKEERGIGDIGEAMYSVWLSFVEIYNENIYDLLGEDESQVNRLSPLRLVKDKQGRAFVQGLRMICATTGIEAHRILMTGQSKLTVGPTSLNPQSSRSHSIFTMKLLKYVKERKPQEVQVSTITFCDLAGTGRSRKSAGTGNELKEAKNINTSLLVLGRCLKGTSDCQTSRQNPEIIGPFRESKLTRLFERVLTGKEDLAMIVNIDTSPDLHVETLSVLNFSAIAKKILVESEKDAKRLWEATTSSPKPVENLESQRPTSCSLVKTAVGLEVAEKSDFEQLKEAYALLMKENDILKETALNREQEIRNEMSNLYGGIIKDLEANWRKRTNDVQDEHDDFLKLSIQQIENFNKERIDNLSTSKRRRTSGGDQKDDGKMLLEEIETKNAAFTAEVLVLRKTVKKLKEEQEILNADKNKCVFELGLVKHELRQVRNLLKDESGEKVSINDETKVVDDLRALIDEKNEKLKNLQSKICLQSTDIANVSNLESFATEELEKELRKRNGYVSTMIQLEKTILVEEPKTIELAEKVDAKFSTSTFKKESRLFTVSSEQCTVVETKETDEEVNIKDSIISPEHLVAKIVTDESISNLHNCFFDTMDKAVQSDDKNNDSGISESSNKISWSTENSVECVTAEKGSQTSSDNDLQINEKDIQLRNERVDQLKLDYTKLTTELFQDTIRVNEFAEKLKSIQLEVSELKEKTCKNEQTIVQYRDQLASREKNLANLGQIKREMESKLSDISRQLESTSVSYEGKILELRAELKLSEETDHRKTKTLEEHLEKLSYLESQLSATHDKLDKTSLKCFAEHIPKIEKLEQELAEKTMRVNELDGKVLKCERDMERVRDLNEKVTVFGTIFDKYQSERDELRRQLLERLETQSALESKLKRLTNKVRERENEISVLGTDLGNIVKMNMENSEKARELSKEISLAVDRLASAESEMERSGDERRKLERTSGHEIANIMARLADFEKNAAQLARMRDNEDLRMDELDRLKLLMHDKEREMCLFKKNRDKTIRRYEALIRKLQAEVEMQCNRESSKLRMLYPKKVISKESVKSLSESFRWKSTLFESVKRKKSSQDTVLTKKNSHFQSLSRNNNHRWHQSYPTCSRCSVVKRSSSQALVNSSTSLEGSRSSSSKMFHMQDDDDEDRVDHETIETESCTELNLDIVERLDYQRRESFSQAAGTFSIPSTSDDSRTDFHDLPGWTEIRRTNGRTHFWLRKGDSDIDSEDKDKR